MGHLVDFGLGFSGRFKIGFCVNIDFYIPVNPFLSRVKSGFTYKSSENRVIGFVLNTYTSNILLELGIDLLSISLYLYFNAMLWISECRIIQVCSRPFRTKCLGDECSFCSCSKYTSVYL